VETTTRVASDLGYQALIRVLGPDHPQPLNSCQPLEAALAASHTTRRRGRWLRHRTITD
jgi:hypothetical protein